MPLWLILKNAEIDRVIVEKQARKWHFHFQFERIIPCKLYSTFTSQLERTFSHIANISYTVKVLEQTANEQEILDYWKVCVKEIDGIAPPLLKLLNEQIPKIQGTKLNLSVRNETEGLALKRKYASIIADIYQGFGFPMLTVDTEISKNASSDEYDQFLKAKEKEDQERGLMAMIEMQKKEAEKSQGDGAQSDGPLTIGLTIKDAADFRKLEEIVDEERRDRKSVV